jgi:hypothetical protein
MHATIQFNILSSRLVPRNPNMKIYRTVILAFRVCNLVFHIRGRTQTENVEERDSKENVWT